MAIRVKAIERNVAFVKGEEKWAYVLQADLYNKLSDAKVIKERYPVLCFFIVKKCRAL